MKKSLLLNDTLHHALITSALDGVSDQLHAPAALPPGKETPVAIG
jgi:hypothetical protein